MSVVLRTIAETATRSELADLLEKQNNEIAALRAERDAARRSEQDCRQIIDTYVSEVDDLRRERALQNGEVHKLRTALGAAREGRQVGDDAIMRQHLKEGGTPT